MNSLRQALYVMTLVSSLGCGYEQQASPGYILNGDFAGRWRIDPSEEDPNGGAVVPPDTVAFKILERNQLHYGDPHSSSGFPIPVGVLCSGTVELAQKICPFQLEWREHDPGFTIAYDPSGSGMNSRQEFTIFMDAHRGAGGSPRLPWRDILYVQFEPSEPTIRYLRE